MYDYNYQYQLRSGNSRNGKYKHETVLTATFLFGSEVPPSKRKETKERCRIYSIEQGPLDRFITENLGYMHDYRNIFMGELYRGPREILTVTPLLFRLGFKIKSEARGHLPLEEMISLDALNHFVLTGESTITKEQNQIKELQEQQA